MNELGPRGLSEFRRDFFSGYHGDPLEAPIELAREVVFGSIAYARNLMRPASDRRGWSVALI
jgi:hypothetical protein